MAINNNFNRESIARNWAAEHNSSIEEGLQIADLISEMEAFYAEEYFEESTVHMINNASAEAHRLNVT